MKYWLFVLMIIFSAGISADPFKTIIKYECERVNKADYGFKCNGVESGYFLLHRTKKGSEMSTQYKNESQYQLESLIMKFIQLGGRYIDITASYIPKDEKLHCTAKNNRTGYRCLSYKCLKHPDGGESCEPK